MTLSSGIELIKQFEGCHTTAYLCPAKVWTIGWGNTTLDGRPVRQGDKITQAKADQMLAETANTFVKHLQKIPYWDQMTADQQGALLSFAWNLGASFYGSPDFKTISSRLKNKEWDKVPEALMLYHSPGSAFSEGLKRRRKAEGALWLKGLSMTKSEGYAADKEGQKGSTMPANNPTQYADLVDAVRHFADQPQQVQAFRDLQADLTPTQREKFTKTWRSTPAAPAKPAPAPGKPKFPLDTIYHWQRDSKTGHGERMCQSSSIAMRIEQIDPNIIKGDDDYLQIVHRYGDTTAQSAHQKALDHLGLKHAFRQNGTEKMLCDLLDRGIIVPIGILHKGPISSPTGGGHWVALTGYDTTHFWVNDPFGELDLVNGGYPKTGPTDGKNVRYSRKNLMKRWLIASSSDGWLWEITR